MMLRVQELKCDFRWEMISRSSSFAFPLSFNKRKINMANLAGILCIPELWWISGDFQARSCSLTKRSRQSVSGRPSLAYATRNLSLLEDHKLLESIATEIFSARQKRLRPRSCGDRQVFLCAVADRDSELAMMMNLCCNFLSFPANPVVNQKQNKTKTNYLCLIKLALVLLLIYLELRLEAPDHTNWPTTRLTHLNWPRVVRFRKQVTVSTFYGRHTRVPTSGWEVLSVRKWKIEFSNRESPTECLHKLVASSKHWESNFMLKTLGFHVTCWPGSILSARILSEQQATNGEDLKRVAHLSGSCCVIHSVNNMHIVRSPYYGVHSVYYSVYTLYISETEWSVRTSYWQWTFSED